MKKDFKDESNPFWNETKYERLRLKDGIKPIDTENRLTSKHLTWRLIENAIRYTIILNY